MVVLPALFFGFTWLARRLAAGVVPMKQVFLSYAYLLVPLGLLAWIAFSVPLIFVNGAYILPVLSDPFGWGWDLFGTAQVAWSPVWPEYLVFAQIALLMYGLYVALRKAYAIGLTLFGSNTAATRGLVPMGVFSLAITLAFISFFAG